MAVEALRPGPHRLGLPWEEASSKHWVDPRASAGERELTDTSLGRITVNSPLYGTPSLVQAPRHPSPRRHFRGQHGVQGWQECRDSWKQLCPAW